MEQQYWHFDLNHAQARQALIETLTEVGPEPVELNSQPIASQAALIQHCVSIRAKELIREAEQQLMIKESNSSLENLNIARRNIEQLLWLHALIEEAEADDLRDLKTRLDKRLAQNTQHTAANMVAGAENDWHAAAQRAEAVAAADPLLQEKSLRIISLTPVQKERNLKRRTDNLPSNQARALRQLEATLSPFRDQPEPSLDLLQDARRSVQAILAQRALDPFWQKGATDIGDLKAGDVVRAWTRRRLRLPIVQGDFLAITPDGKTLAMAEEEGKKLVVYRKQGERYVKAWGIDKPFERGLRAAALSNDGAQLCFAVGEIQSTIYLYSLKGPGGGSYVKSQDPISIAHAVRSSGLKFSSDRTRLLVLSYGSVAVYAQPAQGAPYQQKWLSEKRYQSADISGDGKMIALGTKQDVALWEMTATAPFARNLWSNADIAGRNVSLSSDGRLLAVSGDTLNNKQIRGEGVLIFETVNAAPRLVWSLPRDPGQTFFSLSGTKLSPDGSTLIYDAGQENYTARITLGRLDNGALTAKNTIKVPSHDGNGELRLLAGGSYLSGRQEMHPPGTFQPETFIIYRSAPGAKLKAMSLASGDTAALDQLATPSEILLP